MPANGKNPPKKRKQRDSYAHKDLKGMACFEEFHKKIVAGVVLEEIARWLQEDMYQQVDIKRESLVS